MDIRELQRSSKDYYRIERVISYIQEHFLEQPGLEELARSAGMSAFHFHRLFTRWAGISPKKFVQYLTIGYAKRLLEESRPVLEAAYEAGLSGPGRLHDLFVTFEAITPGEYKKKGVGVTIRYGFHPTPFGECLVAVTERGVCGLSFIRDGRGGAVGSLSARWMNSSIVHDQSGTREIIRRIFAGARPKDRAHLNLFVKGTNFQVKVWEALMKIPAGAVAGYGDVAAGVGRPGASRAVGGAVAVNPVGFIIPCHRVIRKTGVIDGYQWGSERKMAILGWEAAARRG
jgi:AraC family transcriptional regulator of adaptative response/methylated-DNA-[protein]-cysteine methyltransferase